MVISALCHLTTHIHVRYSVCVISHFVRLVVDHPLVQQAQRTASTAAVVKVVRTRLSPHAPALEPLHWSVKYIPVAPTCFKSILKILLWRIKLIKVLWHVQRQPIYQTYQHGQITQGQPCGMNVLHQTMGN